MSGRFAFLAILSVSAVVLADFTQQASDFLTTTSRSGQRLVEPSYDEQSLTAVLQRYAQLKIPYEKLRKPTAIALSFLESNINRFNNKSIITIIDYNKPEQEPRFYVYDLGTGAVESFLTTNGRNSDPQHTGYATRFGDDDGGYMTRLGFFETANVYGSSKWHANALRLIGLSVANEHALEYGVVIHPAWYLNPSKNLYGRSEGCPALEPAVAEPIIELIKDGSLILSWHGE